MKFKKSLLIICIVVCLFSIASVSANEIDDAAITMEDNEIIAVDDGNSIDSAAECFQRMIKRRLQKRDYWLETDGVDAVALKTLVERGIIVHDSLFLRYYLAHDVYEEIAIERLIDAIRMDGDNSKFFDFDVSNLHERFLLLCGISHFSSLYC